MKYFICALDEINLGIPAEQTERLIPVNRVQTSISETENQETFISLPVLFRMKDPAALHGIVLKTDSPDKNTLKKNIMITPKIDIDMDIPEDGILKLPEIMTALTRYFKGVFFFDKKAVLLLDIIKLVESVK